MLRQLTVGLTVCAALAACSGGSIGVLPSASKAGNSGLQSVTLAIHIPSSQSSTSSIRRRPLYISQHTQSASISINNATPIILNLGPNSPNCVAAGGGSTCSVTINAPVGVDTFAEKLYATTDGSGPALSQNVTSATIVAGKANVIGLVLDGVIASMSLQLSNATPPQGIAATLGLTVNFKDAGGETIIGNDPFANPIALADSDKTATQLSQTALNSPADAAGLTVKYSGAQLSSAIFTATATGAPAAQTTLSPTPVNFNDYTTFGFDNQRDVYNPNSGTITPSSVGNLHLAWQQRLGGVGDYNVQAQPILATEVPNHAGVLFAGGGSGNISAHDALTGKLLWKTYTGQIRFTCGPGQPLRYFGIAGTAAYDPASRLLYVAANSNTSINGVGADNLVQIDAASGAIDNTVNLSPTQLNSYEINFAHTAVTLGNGIAYAGTGSTCDLSSWRGRVAGVNVSDMSLAATYFPLWNPPQQPYGGGGIWGWGGVSLDSAGSVYTSVGNADNGISNGTIAPPFVVAPQEYSGNGEAFLKISGDLSSLEASDHPIPRNLYSDQVNDIDLNGTPALFTPFGTGCDTMAAVQGKSGALYLFDTTRISNGPSAVFQLAPSTYADGFLGDPAFSKATGLLYAGVASSVSPNLYAPGMIAINPGCGSPGVTWHAAFGPDSTDTGVPRSVPAVSSGGVIFIATSCDSTSGSCMANGNYGALWELDAANGNVLNGGKPVLYTNAAIRAPATVDGNWVYVVDTVGDMYGLTIDTSYPAVAAIRRAGGTPQTLGRAIRRP